MSQKLLFKENNINTINTKQARELRWASEKSVIVSRSTDQSQHLAMD